jgi:hypothetical protein
MMAEEFILPGTGAAVTEASRIANVTKFMRRSILTVFEIDTAGRP